MTQFERNKTIREIKRFYRSRCRNRRSEFLAIPKSTMSGLYSLYHNKLTITWICYLYSGGSLKTIFLVNSFEIIDIINKYGKASMASFNDHIPMVAQKKYQNQNI